MAATRAPFEPLDRLARFSWDWAPALCDPAHGCTDYHRSWSLVRLLELGGALPAGLPFFERELAALAREGRRRVLVCGGADTGVTALAVSAFRAAGVAPDIVFLDRCRTTCAQNELMLRELGLGAEVLVADARDVACAPVDAVVAHSFLHLLPAAVRPGVLQGWARVLKPGGRVLMSCGLSDDEADWVRLKDAGEIGARRDSLAQAADRAGYSPSDAAEIAETAARFWATSPGQAPALTEANLRDAFGRAGLEVLAIDRLPFEEARGPIALTTREGSRRRRAEVLARRP